MDGPRQRCAQGVHAVLRPGQRSRVCRPRARRRRSGRRYFERLGSDVNAGLAGVGVDNNGVLAGKRLWPIVEGGLAADVRRVLRIPDESHLIRATVAFDFVAAAGGLAVAGDLAAKIRTAREHPAFMRLMARTAVAYPVALGFRGQLAVGRGGIRPRGSTSSAARSSRSSTWCWFHALANGITISDTLDRITAVADVGGLDRGLADGLSETFERDRGAAVRAPCLSDHRGRPARQPDRPGRTSSDCTRRFARRPVRKRSAARRRRSARGCRVCRARKWRYRPHLPTKLCSRTPLNAVIPMSKVGANVRYCWPVHEVGRAAAPARRPPVRDARAAVRPRARQRRGGLLPGSGARQAHARCRCIRRSPSRDWGEVAADLERAFGSPAPHRVRATHATFVIGADAEDAQAWLLRAPP